MNQDSQGRIGPMVGRLRMPVPRPGSGGDCRCPVWDNAHGAGINSQFWVRSDCPIHGSSAALGTMKEGDGGEDAVTKERAGK
jgi:hypothetical protein